MTSEATRSKKINEIGINENEPPRFEQDVQKKPHDDGEKNKSSSIRERTTQPLVKPQQSSVPFPNRVRKEKEEALQQNFLENLKQLDINIPFIEALVQIPKYAKYLKSLLTNKSKLEEACTETINERCSAVLLNELPLKEKDPGSFTIPCQVLEKHKETKDLAADHSSRLENPHMEVLTEREITDEFSDEHLMALKSKSNNDEPCLKKLYKDIGVTHKLATAYHPQSNGKTEVTNRAIKRILERSVGYNPKGWSEKLNDALWAFRTAYKTPTGCTPFRLVYGKACHLPVEIEHKVHWALKQCNMDLTLASESRLMQLNELAELRDGAYDNTRTYKERTKKWHDSRLHGDKDLKVGDKVLLYNSHLKMYPGKLKSKWSDPNIVKTVYPHGAIEITDSDGFSFKVNGQRLKKYYGGDIDKEDDEVLELENDTTRS
ncbi:reverse transcriptase domain-containing protein [Tanacetum coccineum]|uniref:Reverse transcriptase domain-containing protein n=1 Tax=Tanacetum coccineum TaxID=301880 RepID=A0ABQ5IG56_9ASTR